MSREIEPERAPIDSLKPWIGPNVLVVGARLAPDHGPTPGTHSIHAYNSPWNTLAVWNAHLLGLTGFPTVSDGQRRDLPAGMEEVTAISLLQHMFPRGALAYLVQAVGIHWRQPADGSKRNAAHEAKMQSKEQRSEAQIQRMGIARGRVHVVTGSHAQFVMAATLPPPVAADADDARDRSGGTSGR
jgi:hypothetical protein